MGLIQAVQSVYRNYANFNGRAGRPEFWWFTLCLWLSPVLLFIPVIGVIIWFVLYIASIIPTLAVTSRRLHDTGRTGWWGLLYIFGIIGAIIIYVLCAQAGNPHGNRYGPNPLQPQQGMGGYPYSQPGELYTPPPPPGGFETPAQLPPQAPPVQDTAPDPNRRQFCTQCGMQLQADARFCSVCGTAV